MNWGANVNWGVIVTVAMLATGCATRLPGRQAFNAEAHRDILRIALVEPAAPRQIVVSPGAFEQIAAVAAQSGAGGVFLLPVLAVAAADKVDKTTRFTELARSTAFDLPAFFAAELEVQLTRLGYSVVRHPVDRSSLVSPTEPAWLDDYSRWRDTADVALDVRLLLVGFSAVAPTQPYIPTLSVSARLVGTRSGLVYYRDTSVFGIGTIPSRADFAAGHWRAGLVAEPDHKFKDFEDLLTRHAAAFDTLRIAARALAIHIAFDLAPR